MLWRHGWRRLGVMVGDNFSASTGFHRKLTPLPPLYPPLTHHAGVDCEVR